MFTAWCDPGVAILVVEQRRQVVVANDDDVAAAAAVAAVGTAHRDELLPAKRDHSRSTVARLDVYDYPIDEHSAPVTFLEPAPITAAPNVRDLDPVNQKSLRAPRRRPTG